MLKTLFISNYALIDELEINFDKGLNIITGETGAGKSIILGALSLILGERANLQAVRDASRKTVVEAAFTVSGYGLDAFFEANDIDNLGEECIMRREITSAGRSRAFINDSPVSLTLLRELAARLIDIHSQHSNMLLTSEQFQLTILDNLSHNQKRLEEYSSLFNAMKATQAELAALKAELARSQADEDYLRFQFNQLSELRLQEGEDEELEQKQNRLANVAELKAQLWNVQSLLDGDNHSVIESLKQARHSLEAVEQAFEEAHGMGERVSNSLIEIKDVAATVASLQDSLVDDPQELQRIDDRLNDIYALERKHNVDTVNALLALQNDYEIKLRAIDNSDERIAEIETRLACEQEKAGAAAAMLSRERQSAAKSFEKQLKEMAAGLGLKNLNFIIDFKSVPLNATGSDQVAFLVSFNKNQLPMQVRDTASGGEISRLMLCIKAILAQTMHLPTLIFDEVDTGVSGDTASMVGELMGGIARNIQVIAITHLPQVASHGNAHLKVYKTDCDNSTVTSVRLLDDDERVLEIARMLSGRELNDAAIANAKALINQNKQDEN